MRLALVVTFVMALAGSAQAESASDVADACGVDLARFCAGQSVGSEGAMGCLRTHRTEVSQPCRKALAARRERLLERVRSACGGEIANFCAGNKNAGRAPIHCLRSHASQLSPACKATLPRSTS